MKIDNSENDNVPPFDYEDVYFDEVNHAERGSSISPSVVSDEPAPRKISKFAPPPRVTTVKASDILSKSVTPLNDVHIAQSDDLPNWEKLIDKLHLRGLVKQLAQQSELLVLDEHRIEIRCENRVLAVSNAAVSGMEKALNLYFKDSPKTLKVHVGVVAVTPAKVQATVKAVELKGAQEIVAQNETVQALVKEFDGMVLPNSIRAIE